jgi:hypothetical protein
MSNKNISYSLSFCSMTLGLAIYWLFREDTPLNNLMGNYSSQVFLVEGFASKWFVYSAPDALWMFSFVLAMFTLWDWSFSAASAFWIVSSIGTGLIFELLQKSNFVPGTFDPKDIYSMLLATAVALLTGTLLKMRIHESKRIT